LKNKTNSQIVCQFKIGGREKKLENSTKTELHSKLRDEKNRAGVIPRMT
jgi:hypothetical protein